MAHVIVFANNWRNYNAGETAGFEESIAADLVKRGIAKPYSAEVQKAAPPSPEPAKVPTLEEVVKAGYTLRAAHAIVAEQEALAAGMTKEEAALMRDDAVKMFDELHPAEITPPPPPPELAQDAAAATESATAQPPVEITPSTPPLPQAPPSFTLPQDEVPLSEASLESGQVGRRKRK